MAARIHVSELRADGSVKWTANYHDMDDMLNTGVADMSEQGKAYFHGINTDGLSSAGILTAGQAAELLAAGILDTDPDGWTFGHETCFVGDAAIICRACAAIAIADMVEADVTFSRMGADPVYTVFLTNEDDALAGGTICDVCNEYIIEPEEIDMYRVSGFIAGALEDERGFQHATDANAYAEELRDAYRNDVYDWQIDLYECMGGEANDVLRRMTSDEDAPMA